LGVSATRRIKVDSVLLHAGKESGVTTTVVCADGDDPWASTSEVLFDKITKMCISLCV
jgi:hypothetical protein